jgi:hypothetical protein
MAQILQTIVRFGSKADNQKQIKICLLWGVERT